MLAWTEAGGKAGSKEFLSPGFYFELAKLLEKNYARFQCHNQSTIQEQMNIQTYEIHWINNSCSKCCTSLGSQE